MPSRSSPPPSSSLSPYVVDGAEAEFLLSTISTVAVVVVFAVDAMVFVVVVVVAVVVVAVVVTVDVTDVFGVVDSVVTDVEAVNAVDVVDVDDVLGFVVVAAGVVDGTPLELSGGSDRQTVCSSAVVVKRSPQWPFKQLPWLQRPHRCPSSSAWCFGLEEPGMPTQSQDGSGLPLPLQPRQTCPKEPVASSGEKLNFGSVWG